MGRRGLICCLSLLVAGCSSTRQDDTTPFVTSAPATDTLGGQTTGSAETGSDVTTGGQDTGPDTGDEASDDSPVKFDLEQEDIEVPDAMGCDKIDFVFSVDNSCSTEDDQATLQQAFAQFVQLIRDNVQGQDWHIIVVDSDGDPTWACDNGAASCCTGFVPGSYAFTACDLEMGAGVISPHGGQASNMDCGVPAGRRYLTGDDEPLDDMFACIAQVGTSGSFSEFPVTAAVNALQNPMGCNDGFLRDDAILVMTVITDDHDGDFSYPGDAENGNPQAWYDSIVAAKNGNEDATVFIGLTSNHCMAPPVPPFQQIVSLFGDQGVQGSNCSLAEMLDTFETAVMAIDTTCDGFIPG